MFWIGLSCGVLVGVIVGVGGFVAWVMIEPNKNLKELPIHSGTNRHDPE